MAVTSRLAAVVTGGLILCTTVTAAVLPEDRTEMLYHRYEGGGITIDGPSVLVRKQVKDKVSLWGNYYVDNISGASIDLLARGSDYYEERREEHSLGFDYIKDRTILSLSHTNSSERDYEANTIAFGLSQEFFGDMTTLSMSYSQGNDEVRQNIYQGSRIVDTIHRGDARHQRFGFGLTQVMTPRWLLSANIESVIDDGFLNNPYRSVRFLQASGVGTEAERYPETRNSDAFAIRSLVYLPYRAALRFEYRTYFDSWGIEADNYELRYLHPYDEHWLFEVKYRAYSQSRADFYADLFPFQDAQTYLARDKELSSFDDSAFGFGINYTFSKNPMNWIDETALHFYWDFIQFNYSDFRENLPSNPDIGNEPLYGFDANIIRLFLSLNY